MTQKVELFMKRKGLYLMKLLGLCRPVIIVMILLPFVDSLIFKTESHSYTESHANRFYEIHEDFRLIGHVIETSTTDEFNCGLRCARNYTCRSYNYYSDQHHGNEICELNDYKQHTKPRNLIPSKGFTYFEKAKQGWYRDQPGHSCKHILDSGDSRGNGQYWIDPESDGNTVLDYCDMRTGSVNQPGHSCKHILDSGDSRGDGEYWIDPEKNGNPLSVFCDMTTDGGGWLLIFNIVINVSPPSTLGIETSYRGISNYTNNNMVLKTTALHELRTHLPFAQLRFHCNKQTARTFHVATVPDSIGEAVVQFFSRQIDTMPNACGSFARLEGDNSVIAGDCNRWGKDYGAFWVGKWGHEGMRELYKFPAFIAYDNNWAPNPEWPRWECDDRGTFVSTGDFWKIYVR